MFSINVNPHLLWKHIAWNQFLPSRMACFIRKNSNCNQNIESLINHLVSHLRIPWPIFVIYQVKDLYIWVSTFLELYIYYFKGVSKNMLKYNKKYNIVPKISMALLYRKMTLQGKGFLHMLSVLCVNVTVPWQTLSKKLLK